MRPADSRFVERESTHPSSDESDVGLFQEREASRPTDTILFLRRDATCAGFDLDGFPGVASILEQFFAP